MAKKYKNILERNIWEQIPMMNAFLNLITNGNVKRRNT